VVSTALWLQQLRVAQVVRLLPAVEAASRVAVAKTGQNAIAWRYSYLISDIGCDHVEENLVFENG
jgi:hypothetical protein